MRGIRKAIKADFEATVVPKLRKNGLYKLDAQGNPVLTQIGKGRHHWEEERWFQKAR